MLAELSLAEFCERIASNTPSPGAGAAGAVALAVGVACARKAIAITLKHRPDEQALRDHDLRLRQISREAFDGADQDARAFAALVAEHGAAHADSEARTGRFRRLIDIGERLAALGDEARRIIQTLQNSVHPSMTNDVNVALALAAVDVAVQCENVAEARGEAG